MLNPATHRSQDKLNDFTVEVLELDVLDGTSVTRRDYDMMEIV